MKSSTARRLRVLFYAYVAVTFCHLAYVVNREPFSFDAWNVSVYTGAKPATLGRFFAFWHQTYTTSNPRIGQPFAYLAYKLVGFAEIGTPLAYFAIVLAAFVIGVGRWPSRKNDRDLAVLAIGIGLLWIAGPNLPAYMFCRAYATNYIWAIAIQLWFVVPLRLRGAAPIPTSTPALAGYFVLGVAAGMCNEHTGPTLVALTLVYALWSRRRGRTAPLVWIGLVGLFVGYAIIFFAPGQAQRYDGLAEHYSLVEQILVRGFSGNFDIFLEYLWAIAPLLVLATLAIAGGLFSEDRERPPEMAVRHQQRDALAIVAVVLAVGACITITVFASPKLGPRFYLHSGVAMLAALLGVIAAFSRSPRTLAPFVVLAMIVSIYAGFRTIPSYTRVKRESDARLAELAATPIGGVDTIQAWPQITESWWTLGDDARDQKKQEMIASYFGLERVLFRGNDMWKTLGVSDVKLTMEYELDPPMCLDEVEQLDLKPYVGRDVGGIQHAFVDEITEIELQTHAHVRSIDLVATFLGSQPPMPRPRMYVARYKDGKLEGYTAGIKRPGRVPERQVVLSPELARADMDIYVIAIGDPPKRLGTTHDAHLSYEPWKSGPYWIAACRRDDCFVVFTTTHAI
ncbi:MAG TPA: DUF6056 family protein [Kofleriaceae bacterium]|jgi:hypothetical protein